MSSVLDLGVLSPTLNLRSSAAAASALAAAASTSSADAQASTQSDSPSAIVSLSSTPDAIAAAAQATLTRAWANASTDAVSSLMSRNFAQSDIAQRLAGLGAAALNRLKTDTSNFSQSLVSYTSGQDQQANALAQQSALTQVTLTPTHAFDLTLKTQSGATVDLKISSSANGLSVDLSASRPLSQAERDAVSGLADTLENTMQGLLQQPPSINVEALTKFDSSIFASVSLSASFSGSGIDPVSFSFYADTQKRSLDLSTKAGEVKMDISLNDARIWGNAAQRAKAVANYLQQVDAAARRGNANATLVTMFKSAFAQMQAYYPGDAGGNQTVASQSLKPLGSDVTSLLTGLADFNASMHATPVASNPMRPGEVDTFDYQTLQTTTVTTGADWRLSQKQAAALLATFHRALSSDDAPQLTTDSASQNYRYFRISDQASSTLNLRFSDGNLVTASLVQSIVQTMQILVFQRGKQTDTQNLPSQSSRNLNLLPLLNGQDRQVGSGRLADLNNKLLLDAYPAAAVSSA